MSEFVDAVNLQFQPAKEGHIEDFVFLNSTYLNAHVVFIEMYL